MNDNNNKNRKISSYMWTFLFILSFFYLIFPSSQSGESSRSLSQARVDLSYSDFLSQVDSGNIKQASVYRQTVSGILTDGSYFSSTIPFSLSQEIPNRLAASGASVVIKDSSESGGFWSLLSSFGPILLLIGFWFFMMRGVGKSGPLSMIGKSRMKEMKDLPHVTFQDVAGVDEAKNDLVEIVDYLKNPTRFEKLGGRIPKGVLLVGPPGTGKTLLARAVAGEANVPFFSLSGSDFVEMFVGVGAARVRDMFEKAKKAAPCIVFIDEIDAVGRSRGVGLGGGNDEREQTLNQLLVEMDGFEGKTGIILIAATNRPDVLDAALVRPGRFDRQVVVGIPDLQGRFEILSVHASRVALDPSVDLLRLAKGTPGFSGADLENLVNEAALMAGRSESSCVRMIDFEKAKDKILMGSERRSLIMSEEDRRMTAYHEAGHALLSYLIDGNDPVHKVSIIPRGKALGVTVTLPEGDRFGYKKKEILARLCMLFGGRVAEQLVFGEDNVSTGAGDDIRKATDLAKRMVTEWGMSSLGPLRFLEESESYLGRSQSSYSVSQKTFSQVDDEIRSIILDSEKRTRDILSSYRLALDEVAHSLLEFETISGEHVEKIVRKYTHNR